MQIMLLDLLLLKNQFSYWSYYYYYYFTYPSQIVKIIINKSYKKWIIIKVNPSFSDTSKTHFNKRWTNQKWSNHYLGLYY
jgi:phenylpropionate dioxygenase-like ring-hydroxylating dioxygenase large terminal subunit